MTCDGIPEARPTWARTSPGAGICPYAIAIKWVSRTAVRQIEKAPWMISDLVKLCQDIFVSTRLTAGKNPTDSSAGAHGPAAAIDETAPTALHPNITQH